MIHEAKVDSPIPSEFGGNWTTATVKTGVSDVTFPVRGDGGRAVQLPSMSPSLVSLPATPATCMYPANGPGSLSAPQSDDKTKVQALSEAPRNLPYPGALAMQQQQQTRTQAQHATHQQQSLTRAQQPRPEPERERERESKSVFASFRARAPDSGSGFSLLRRGESVRRPNASSSSADSLGDSPHRQPRALAISKPLPPLKAESVPSDSSLSRRTLSVIGSGVAPRPPLVGSGSAPPVPGNHRITASLETPRLLRDGSRPAHGARVSIDLPRSSPLAPSLTPTSSVGGSGHGFGSTPRLSPRRERSQEWKHGLDYAALERMSDALPSANPKELADALRRSADDVQAISLYLTERAGSGRNASPAAHNRTFIPGGR